MILNANGPGIGDAIILSAVAYHYHKTYPNEPITIVSNYPELFKNNPDISKAVGNWNHPEFIQLHSPWNLKRHVVQFILQQYNIIPPKWEDIRQYIYIEPIVLLTTPYITFQVKASNWTKNKDWSTNFWEELVLKVRDKLNIEMVQVGGLQDPIIKYGRNDWLKLNSLSITTSLIKGANLHICIDSGTMHIASGTGTKSIVIWGGRGDPFVIGYANNINIQVDPHRLINHTRQKNCSPCWKIEDCPYGWYSNDEFYKPCMQLISVDRVFEEVKKCLSF